MYYEALGKYWDVVFEVVLHNTLSIPARILAAVFVAPMIERRMAALSLLTPLSTAQSGSMVNTLE